MTSALQLHAPAGSRRSIPALPWCLPAPGRTALRAEEMHLNEQERRREVMVELGRHIPDCTISNEQLPNDCYKVLS